PLETVVNPAHPRHHPPFAQVASYAKVFRGRPHVIKPLVFIGQSPYRFRVFLQSVVLDTLEPGNGKPVTAKFPIVGKYILPHITLGIVTTVFGPCRRTVLISRHGRAEPSIPGGPEINT